MVKIVFTGCQSEGRISPNKRFHANWGQTLGTPNLQIQTATNPNPHALPSDFESIYRTCNRQHKQNRPGKRTLSDELRATKTNNRGRRKYGNKIPWQCSWRSSGDISGTFVLKPHIFMCASLSEDPHTVPNCSCELFVLEISINNFSALSWEPVGVKFAYVFPLLL